METYQVTTPFLTCVWHWKQSALGVVESGLWDKVITHPAFIACSIANNESWDMRSWRAATYNKWELWWEKLEMWDSTRHPPVHVTACMGCPAFPSSPLTLRNRTITDKATHCSHEWNDYCTTMSENNMYCLITYWTKPSKQGPFCHGSLVFTHHKTLTKVPRYVSHRLLFYFDALPHWFHHYPPKTAIPKFHLWWASYSLHFLCRNLKPFLPTL